MSALDPRERDLVKCEDMRIHAERACEFLGERTLDEFLGDQLIQAAVIQCGRSLARPHGWFPTTFAGVHPRSRGR